VGVSWLQCAALAAVDALPTPYVLGSALVPKAERARVLIALIRQVSSAYGARGAFMPHAAAVVSGIGTTKVEVEAQVQ
jgi:hypothetical protein